MDTGKGKFEQVQAINEQELKEKQKLLEEKYSQHGAWFREGQLISINGSLFRVKRIKPTEITLKLMKRVSDL